MADFLPAYKEMRRIEGKVNLGWVNDPDDPGKETIAGIARAFHPNAAVWVLVDGAKRYADFPENLTRDALREQLEVAIGDFYFEVFWKPLRLGDFPYQPLADEMLEHCVNLGHGAGTMNLQTVLNGLNLYGRRWADIEVDGKLGQKTVACVHAAHHARLDKELTGYVNCLQGARYIRDRKEKYIKGWYKRVSAAQGA